MVPYQRPPLSKKFLLGELERARLPLRPENWYREQNVTLHTGIRAEAVDRARRRITMSNGTTLEYGQLALTTGSTPRTLPASIGGNLAGVYTLRSVADADAIRRDFGDCRSLLVVGGGYIGLEVAAVAATVGKTVTVVEMADRILQRVAAPATAAIVDAMHRRRGVSILTGTGLARLEGRSGRITAAVLDDGRELDADMAIVGIGIRPNDELAVAAGLDADDGIIVDPVCPNVR